MGSCSIIVPTRNRIAHLKACVASLHAQRGVVFEIIVVNDGSHDGTREYLYSLGDERVRAVHHARPLGPSAARNSGIAQARYPIIACIDDDCIAAPDWAAELVSGFREHDAFVIGETIYREKGYVGYFPERLVRNPGARWPMACNIAFQKSVLEKIGGFDSEYDQYHNEDSELAIRAVGHGYGYGRAVRAQVIHQAQEWTVESLFASSRNASVWPRLKKRYPKHYAAFGPPITAGRVVNIEDYAYFAFLKIVILVLLARYVYHGKRNLVIFFAKWPVWLILRRWYIWREAWKARVFMV